MKNIAIFASGTGSNAKAIINYFNNHATIRVALVVTNNPSAGVIKIAHENKIISAIVNNQTLNNEQVMGPLLKAVDIHFIVLAGFLQKIPGFILARYPNKIVNIHPALLPKFGGNGMYGQRVHRAVLSAGEAESGISVHYVNEHYDEGEIILQKKIAVDPADSPETLAEKVLALEHEWYPRAIEQLLA